MKAVFFAALLFVMPGWAFAQENFSAPGTDALLPKNDAALNLTDPGMLPDNPFYFLKRAVENVRLIIATSEVEKARLHLRYAELRLSEAKAMSDKSKHEQANRTLSEVSKEMNEFNARGLGKNISAAVKEADSVLKKREAILGIISSRISEKARNAISRTLNVSDEKAGNVTARKENNDTENETARDNDLKITDANSTKNVKRAVSKNDSDTKILKKAD